MIRVLNSNDLPELLRLVLENTTHQGVAKSPEFSTHVVKAITNKLILEYVYSPIFGFFNSDKKLLTAINFEYLSLAHVNAPKNSVYVGLNLATNTIPLERTNGTRFPDALLKVADYGFQTCFINDIEHYYTTGPSNPKWEPIVDIYTKKYGAKWKILELVSEGKKSSLDYINKYMSPGILGEQVIKYTKIKAA